MSKIAREDTSLIRTKEGEEVAWTVYCRGLHRVMMKIQSQNDFKRLILNTFQINLYHKDYQETLIEPKSDQDAWSPLFQFQGTGIIKPQDPSPGNLTIPMKWKLTIYSMEQIRE